MQKIIKMIKDATEVAILSHIDEDADALGSSLAMLKMLKKMGIEDELKRKGVKEGNTVKILEWEFEWYE